MRDERIVGASPTTVALEEKKMKDTTVMEAKENTSFQAEQEAQYQQAVEAGFQGTIEQYFSIKNYT